MKRPVISLITVVLGTLYVIGVTASLASAFSSTVDGSNSAAYQAGAAIGISLFLPHLVAAGVGLVFNWVGFGLRKPVFTLVAAIIYSVSIILMPLYILFTAPVVALAWVAYAQERKQNKVS